MQKGKETWEAGDNCNQEGGTRQLNSESLVRRPGNAVDCRASPHLGFLCLGIPIARYFVE